MWARNKGIPFTTYLQHFTLRSILTHPTFNLFFNLDSETLKIDLDSYIRAQYEAF